MISAPWVKRALLDLLAGRPGVAGVALLYGAPEAGSDTLGSDPLYEQTVAFNNPDGALTIDELCGPDRVTYEEEYDLEIVVQVVARNTAAGFYQVEQRRAELVYQITRVLQDPTLGFVAAESDLFDNPIVTATDFVGVSGWLAPASNVAATRGVIQLNIVADIKAET